jgi:ssDNA-binding Zn-finger/Zn-ribbon topoisomerase 1
MSLKALLENFGGKKSEEVQHKEIEATETEVVAERVEGVCEKCGGVHFWRHKSNWFCWQCRKPPTIDFVHEERGGLKAAVVAAAEKLTDSVAVDAYDSVIVAEGAKACPECPCRWVKEIPQENGQLRRICWSCGVEIDRDRHGGTGEFRELPFHLLPFWKWFNERTEHGTQKEVERV